MDFQRFSAKTVYDLGNSGLPAIFSDKRQAGI